MRESSLIFVVVLYHELYLILTCSMSLFSLFGLEPVHARDDAVFRVRKDHVNSRIMNIVIAVV